MRTPPSYCLTWMIGSTMNLISETHYLCERREYAFMVFQEYTIIPGHLKV